MKSHINAAETDLALDAFLVFLAKDLAGSPDRVKGIDVELRNRAQSLIEGIDIDLDSSLAELPE